MVGMRQKLKDVDLEPWMLAIYKDNQHRHLLHHAMDCWKIRKTRTLGGMNVAKHQTNPLTYCPYPPLDMVKEYFPGLAAMFWMGSRILKCSEVATWAFLEVFDYYVEKAQHGLLAWEQKPLTSVFDLILFDDELIYRCITSGLYEILPNGVINSLTPEQQATAIICG